MKNNIADLRHEIDNYQDLINMMTDLLRLIKSNNKRFKTVFNNLNNQCTTVTIGMNSKKVYDDYCFSLN